MLFNGGIFLFFLLILVLFKVFLYWGVTALQCWASLPCAQSAPPWTSPPMLPSSQSQPLCVIAECRVEIPVRWKVRDLFSRSVVSDSAVLWTVAPGFPSFTVSRSLLRLMSTERMRPSNHLAFCGPLLLLPSVFASIRVLSSESALRIRWPK